MPRRACGPRRAALRTRAQLLGLPDVDPPGHRPNVHCAHRRQCAQVSGGDRRKDLRHWGAGGYHGGEQPGVYALGPSSLSVLGMTSRAGGAQSSISGARRMPVVTPRLLRSPPGPYKSVGPSRRHGAGPHSGRPPRVGNGRRGRGPNGYARLLFCSVTRCRCRRWAPPGRVRRAPSETRASRSLRLPPTRCGTLSRAAPLRRAAPWTIAICRTRSRAHSRGSPRPILSGETGALHSLRPGLLVVSCRSVAPISHHPVAPRFPQRPPVSRAPPRGVSPSRAGSDGVSIGGSL